MFCSVPQHVILRILAGLDLKRIEVYFLNFDFRYAKIIHYRCFCLFLYCLTLKSFDVKFLTLREKIRLWHHENIKFALVITGRELKQIVGCMVPCFPENKTGLILIFTPKYGTRAYFRGMCYFDISKNEVTKKNYEILNKQKLRKRSTFTCH